MIVLRLVHIFAGVFWAGATFYLAVFILPAAKAIPEGGKFMQQLTNTNKLPAVMLWAGTLNVLAGLLLVWRMSGGFGYVWFASATGMTLSTGGIFAITAYIIGVTVNFPAINKMSRIGKEIASAGGPPTPEKMQQLMALRNKLTSATHAVAWLLCVTVICMAIGRYM